MLIQANKSHHHLHRLTSQERNPQRTAHSLVFVYIRQCWTVSRCQTTSGYMTALFITIDRMPFLAPTLDNADLIFSPVLAPGFYLDHL